MQAAWLAGELQVPVGRWGSPPEPPMSARDLLLFSFRNYLLGAQIPLGRKKVAGRLVLSVEAQARPAPGLKLVLEIIPHYIIRIHFKVI